MIYAPVYIPTLNRYNHFRRCIESLSACTWAEKTIVYVGLDNPTDEKYIDGHNRIKEYLAEIGDLNFEKIIVLERQTNFGLREYGNAMVHMPMLFETHDRLIFSEDDNIFSPNFLVYINKGLEKYRNDPRVFAICGYKNAFDCLHNDNNHFAQHSLFQAWGYGIWKNRYIRLQNELNPRYFERILLRDKMWRHCNKYWPYYHGFILRNAKSTMNRLWICDINVGFFIVNENLCVINPTVSKVRNCGFDSSATSTNLAYARLSERATFENNIVLDNNKEFDFEGNPYLYEEENSLNISRWDAKWGDQTPHRLIKNFILLWIYRIQHFIGYY